MLSRRFSLKPIHWFLDLPIASQVRAYQADIPSAEKARRFGPTALQSSDVKKNIDATAGQGPGMGPGGWRNPMRKTYGRSMENMFCSWSAWSMSEKWNDCEVMNAWWLWWLYEFMDSLWWLGRIVWYHPVQWGPVGSTGETTSHGWIQVVTGLEEMHNNWCMGQQTHRFPCFFRFRRNPFHWRSIKFSGMSAIVGQKVSGQGCWGKRIMTFTPICLLYHRCSILQPQTSSIPQFRYRFPFFRWFFQPPAPENHLEFPTNAPLN